MNTFKQYAVALVSCLALSGVVNATQAPETGFVVNELTKVIVVQPEYKDGGKGKQITVIKGNKERIEKFDQIKFLNVKIGNSKRFVRIAQCSYPEQHGAIAIEDNDHYNTFFIKAFKGGNPDQALVKCDNTDPDEFKDIQAPAEGFLRNELTKVIIVQPEFADGGKGKKVTVINGKTEKIEKFNEIKAIHVKVGNAKRFIRLEQCSAPKHHGLMHLGDNVHFNTFVIKAIKSSNPDVPTIKCANVRVERKEVEAQE